MKPTPEHIGIVACSAEGAALCYKTICVEGAGFLGPHAHPEVSMHTPSLANYVQHLERGDWRGVADLMLASAEKLARTGADFLICPDNTIHQSLPLVAPRSPLPWLHIAEVVAAEAAARGFRRLGITGTRWLVESDVYPEKNWGSAALISCGRAWRSVWNATASSWMSWSMTCSGRTPSPISRGSSRA
jgi:aspartate racemase